jgi:hypothetical protein
LSISNKADIARANLRQAFNFIKYTSAWPRKARECILRDHLVCQIFSRAPSLPRTSLADGLWLVSQKRALAGAQAAHQLTDALSVLRLDHRMICEWLLRIVQCRRCKGRLERTMCSTRASQQRSVPLVFDAWPCKPFPFRMINFTAWYEFSSVQRLTSDKFAKDQHYNLCRLLVISVMAPLRT